MQRGEEDEPQTQMQIQKESGRRRTYCGDGKPSVYDTHSLFDCAWLQNGQRNLERCDVKRNKEKKRKTR
jgi:hypothetical protein